MRLRRTKWNAKSRKANKVAEVTLFCYGRYGRPFTVPWSLNGVVLLVFNQHIPLAPRGPWCGFGLALYARPASNVGQAIAS